MEYKQLECGIPEELQGPYDAERQYFLALKVNPFDPHVREPDDWLIDLFANPQKFVMEPEDNVDKSMQKLLNQRQKDAGYAPGLNSIVSPAEFKENFKKLTFGALEGLDWTNIFVAGGSILGCILPNAMGFQHSDVDIFLRANSNAEADELLNRLYERIKTNSAKISDGIIESFRGVRAISIKSPFRTFQVVCQLNTSLQEVLFRFDVDCCSLGYDGKRIWASERCRRSMVKRYNILDLSHALPGRYERRLLKYSKRGFAVAVPGLDMTKVNPHLWTKKVNDQGIEGLNKLLLLDKLVTESPDFGDARHFFVTDIDHAINGGESWCRVCHLSKEDHKEGITGVDSTAKHNDKYDVSHALTWERKGAVYQDMENNSELKRKIDDTTLLERSWDYDVYSVRDAPAEVPPPQVPLTSTQGFRTPYCYCNLPCGLRTVKKVSANYGRRFFTCGQKSGPNVEYCGFFAWADTAAEPTTEQLGLKIATVTLPVVQASAVSSSASESLEGQQLLAIGRLFKAGLINAADRGRLKDAVLNQTKVNPLPANITNCLQLAAAAGSDLQALQSSLSALSSNT